VGAAAGAIFLTSLLSILTTLGRGESARQMIVGVVLLLLLIGYARKPKTI
jgi:ribose/xylose/arabinose/galactoside ABC-type transport system permease subunit